MTVHHEPRLLLRWMIGRESHGKLSCNRTSFWRLVPSVFSTCKWKAGWTVKETTLWTAAETQDAICHETELWSRPVNSGTARARDPRRHLTVQSNWNSAAFGRMLRTGALIYGQSIPTLLRIGSDECSSFAVMTFIPQLIQKQQNSLCWTLYVAKLTLHAVPAEFDLL